MYVPEFARSGALWVVAGIVLTAGCASGGGGKQKAVAAPQSPVNVAPTPGAGERDGRGNYRFLMQQGDKKMTADQFDAWMKANGIRVAKGNAQDRAAAVPVVAEKDQVKDKKKKKR